MVKPSDNHPWRRLVSRREQLLDQLTSANRGLLVLESAMREYAQRAHPHASGTLFYKLRRYREQVPEVRARIARIEAELTELDARERVAA